VHSWKPLLAALCSAKVEEGTAKTTRSHCNKVDEDSTDPKRHCTDSKVLFAATETEELFTERTDHHRNDARVFNLIRKAVNRWTALPLSTTETCIRATEQEPDLVLVKKALLETKVTPLRSHFPNKKHHTELVSQRLCFENEMTHQLEQPMATRIRHSQQKVVPSTLCPAFLQRAMRHLWLHAREHAIQFNSILNE
jgi:hypothetical protein